MKIDIKIIFLALALIVVVLGLYYNFKTRDSVEGVACTMEAKMCPDGSNVGRSGPNCEFAACPGF